MNNHLPNGTVLPHGLLGVDTSSKMAAFNRAYKNTSLRLGIVVKSYAISDTDNYSKLCTEYDILVLEQNENISCTNIVYRNCISSEGMGSLADFFEKNLRPQTQNNNANGAVNTSGQNGAIALIQCLDSFTNKAIVVGSFIHPDRETTLIDTSPRLTGEYNGVNIAVQPDGSTALTWNGATDTNGNIINSSGGTTTAQIATDGSLTFTNTTVTMKFDNTNGALTVNINGNANIIATGNTVVDGATIKLGKNASEALILGNTFQTYFNTHIHGTAVGPSSSPVSPMPGSTLSTKVSTE